MARAGSLEKRVVERISRGLLSVGFNKGIYGFEKQITMDFLGWCGLNVTKKNLGGGIAVNPILGVIFCPVEDEIQRVLVGNRKGTTLTSSLGYLMPEQRYLEWIFPPNESIGIDAEDDKIVAAIKLYGEPFMERQANLSAVIENMEKCQFIDRDSASRRLPIAYKLNGESAKARKFTLQQLSEMENKFDIASEERKRLFKYFLNASEESQIEP